MNEKRYFLHEQSINHVRWEETKMKEIIENKESIITRIHDCVYDLDKADQKGNRQITVPTRQGSGRESCEIFRCVSDHSCFVFR